MSDYFPASWRACVDFATHEYDGTYGASLGTQSMQECQVCGAWVTNTELHVGWHRKARHDMIKHHSVTGVNNEFRDLTGEPFTPCGRCGATRTCSHRQAR